MDQRTLVELVLDDEDAWETEEEEDECAGKTNAISNIKIQKRVTEKVDDIIVRQVGVKKWSLEEHMRKKQRRRRGSENVCLMLSLSCTEVRGAKRAQYSCYVH